MVALSGARDFQYSWCIHKEVTCTQFDCKMIPGTNYRRSITGHLQEVSFCTPVKRSWSALLHGRISFSIMTDTLQYMYAFKARCILPSRYPAFLATSVSSARSQASGIWCSLRISDQSESSVALSTVMRGWCWCSSHSHNTLPLGR